jgi:hypothetical protein
MVDADHVFEIMDSLARQQDIARQDEAELERRRWDYAEDAWRNYHASVGTALNTATLAVQRAALSNIPDAAPARPEREPRGLLALHLELWWMRRRLDWMRLPTPDQPTYHRCYRLTVSAISSALSTSAMVLAVRMALDLPAGLTYGLSLALGAFGVLLATWLVSLRFWRPDRSD